VKILITRLGRPHNVKILITGNMGYVGPVVSESLRQAYPDAETIELIRLLAHLLTVGDSLPETTITAQHFGDIRRFPAAHQDSVIGAGGH